MTHVTEVYERSGSWFWSCLTCRWFDGAFATKRRATAAAGRHKARRAA